MNKIDEAVRDFMENHLGIYVNLRGVEITTQLDFSVCLAIQLQEVVKEDICVGLMCLCDTLQEFTRVFNITLLSQVAILGRRELMTKYGEGKAYMYCTIDGYVSYSLYFRRHLGKMTAEDDDEDIHELAELLETPQQLMAYTQEHFRVMQQATGLRRYRHNLNGKPDAIDPDEVDLSVN